MVRRSGAPLPEAMATKILSWVSGCDIGVTSTLMFGYSFWNSGVTNWMAFAVQVQQVIVPFRSVFTCPNANVARHRINRTGISSLFIHPLLPCGVVLQTRPRAIFLPRPSFSNWCPNISIRDIIARGSRVCFPGA